MVEDIPIVRRTVVEKVVEPLPPVRIVEKVIEPLPPVRTTHIVEHDLGRVLKYAVE